MIDFSFSCNTNGISQLPVRTGPKSERFIKGKSLRSSNKTGLSGITAQIEISKGEKNKKMAAPGAGPAPAHPAGRGFWRTIGNGIAAPFRAAGNYRENIAWALGLGAFALGTWYVYNRAKDGIDGFSDRDNPLIVYDNFSFREHYDGGNLFVSKKDGILEVKYSKGGRVMEVNDDDGDREVDAQWYTPKRGQKTKIDRGTTTPEISDIVLKGDKMLSDAYRLAKRKDNLETMSY